MHGMSLSKMSVTTPEGRKAEAEYDPATLLTSKLSVFDFHDTTFGYDPRGRVGSVVTGTRKTSFGYEDGEDGHRITVTADPDGHAYRTVYHVGPDDRLSRIVRADNTTVEFGYDHNGNLDELKNPAGIVHLFGHDDANLPESYDPPISGNHTYVHDRDRRLKKLLLPSGGEIENIWLNGRLERTELPGTEPDVVFSYLVGRLVDGITQGDESLDYAYDGSLVRSETFGGTLDSVLGYGYDDELRVGSFSYAGITESYDYDDDGLPTSAGNFTITRKPSDGLPESVSDGTLTLTPAFNAYGERDGEAYAVGGIPVMSWDTTPDSLGRIGTKTEVVGGVTYAYEYDSVGRLRKVWLDDVLAEEYRHDDDGTRTYEMRGGEVRTPDYDDEDRILSAGNTSYGFDADGFLETKTVNPGEEDEEVTTYDHSSRGELLRVDLPDGKVIEYVHDPLGRRIAKKVNGTIVEKYLWQGLTRLLTVYNADDTPKMRFEYADGRMPAAMMSGERYHLAYDQVGSLKVVADDSGTVVLKRVYDTFGNILSEEGTLSFEMPFGFAGGLHDKDTGLVRFGYRDYDPEIGRWTAKDPIGFAGGDTDLYGYCLSDPVNRIDGNGLWTIQLGSGFNIGAGIGITVSFGGAISYDPKTGKLQIGVYAALGAGLHVGATADKVVDITVSDNDSIESLGGPAETGGGGLALPAVGPHFGVGFETNEPIGSDAKKSYTLSLGPGVGTPGEFHALRTHTFIGTVYESDETSEPCPE